MPKTKIEDIVHAKYDDPDVAAFVLDELKRHNTADRVLSGELTLPGVEDATRTHQIATGTFAATATEAKLRDENKQLLERLDKIESQIASKSHK